MISAQAIGIGSAVGAALLALWVVARYRNFGPQTMRSSLLTVLAAVLVLRGVSPSMAWAMHATNPAVALIVVAVPVFAFAFWSGGLLMRAALNRR